MSEPVIVIANTEKSFVGRLEHHFIKEIGDKVRLEIISSAEYFAEYFSTPRRIDVLVVSEDLYDNELNKHDIKYPIRVLVDDIENDEDSSDIIKILNYTTISQIYNSILRGTEITSDEDPAEPEIIMVYSPIGGSGKTTISLGLSAALSETKKVLYLNTENLNTFSVLLNNKEPLATSAAIEFREDSESIYKNVYHHIRHEGFDYLPPFGVAASSVGISIDMLVKLAEGARASGDYDFVVVDVDSAYTDEKAELMSLADKVILVLLQDRLSASKMETLLNNACCNDGNKFIYVQNRNEPERKSYIEKKYMISQRIDEEKNLAEYSAAELGKMSSFQTLAINLIS